MTAEAENAIIRAQMHIFKIQTALSFLGLIYTLFRFGFTEVISLLFFFVFFLLSLAGWPFGSKEEG